MSTADVDAAIERIRRRDAESAPLVEAAAAGLTAGEGTAVLHQAAVQEFLWAHVPTSWPGEDWHDAVAGAALLLDELGLERYAAIARSDRTAEVLAAWAESPGAGRRSFLAAQQTSGVEPPDTDALEWRTVYGPDEARARTAVERALERAIVAGDLVPGGRHWKAAAAAVAERELTAEVEFPPAQSLLSLVTTERAEAWVRTGAAAEVRRRREAVVRRLLGPIEPPEGVDAVVAPVRWLLERATDGIELTQSGYIARAVVAEAAERFGWWDGERSPRSEADVHQLVEMREVVAHLRLVRRKGRTLVATGNGARLSGDTEGLWRELAATLGGSRDFDRTVAELVGLRLLEGPVLDDDLGETIGPLLTAMGWHTAAGPLTSRDVESATWDRWRWWRTLGLLDRESATWDRETLRQVGHTSTALTPAGGTTVLAYLQYAALGPWDGTRS